MRRFRKGDRVRLSDSRIPLENRNGGSVVKVFQKTVGVRWDFITGADYYLFKPSELEPDDRPGLDVRILTGMG